MTKSKKGSVSGEENSASSLLPLAPRTLCFDKNEFMKNDFSVDNFVADCRRKVRLETLRQDLEIYFKLLKNAMIELINKDYADFVNLSTNLTACQNHQAEEIIIKSLSQGHNTHAFTGIQLWTWQLTAQEQYCYIMVGLDKAIGQLRHPLKSIKEDVTNVEMSINTKVVEVEAAFADQRKLMEKRKLLGHMLGLLKAADKIEHIQRSEEAKNGQALERIAGEFNQLHYHSTFCRGLPVLTQIRQRVAEITGALQRSLESELVQSLGDGDVTKVHRCLNSYALISKTHDAESLVRIHIVEPFMKQVLIEHQGSSDVSDLTLLFQRILELVPARLKLLCDVTSGRKNKSGDQYRGIPGYDFVVNSAWPQIVASFESDLPDMFSSRDPNAFHKRYRLCMEFVSNFERQCGSQASISKLRQSDAYNALMTHWSLPVYFQIRFQEIGGKVEVAFLHPVKEAKVEGTKFRLQSAAIVKQCIETCWNADIFLSALLHRFWKLTLQILARFCTWVKQVHKYQVTSASPPDDFVQLSLSQMAALVVDTDRLVTDVQSIFDAEIKPRSLEHGLKDPSVLQNALDESLAVLKHHRELFVEYIVSSLTAAATPHLKQTQDVPRLYRKTNRPAPTEPSAYLSMVTSPAVQFQLEQSTYVDGELLSDWITQFALVVSEKYYSTVCDVLTSVRKMEESMMRLQKLRSGKLSSNNLSSLAAASDSLSDDDKIRLQLYLDVVGFGKQMTECNVNMEENEKFCLLLKTVKEAKEKRNLG